MKRKEFLKKLNKIRRNGTIVKTFTSDYLLPTVDLTIEDFNDLINVHIKYDNNLPQLVIIFENNDFVHQNIVKCRINNNYIKDYENEDEYIVEFSVPNRYYDIVKSFINGEYSKFSNDYKNKLARIYGKGVCQDGRLVTMYDTIYPRKDKLQQIADALGVELKDLPNGEVYDKPDLSYEIYKEIKQLYFTENITTNNTTEIDEERTTDFIRNNDI